MWPRSSGLWRMMSPIFTPASKVDTNKSYLDAIRSGRLRYISWRPMTLHVRTLGNSGRRRRIRCEGNRFSSPAHPVRY
jgi:hypothetical protein